MIETSFNPTGRARPSTPGESGLFNLMNLLAKYDLDHDNQVALVKLLAHEFNTVVPEVTTNHRLTSTLGRCSTLGRIEMGQGINRVEVLVHEYSHWLHYCRAKTLSHGPGFNRALRDCALKTIAILDLPVPEWKPTEPAHWKFGYGQRVQVNPYRPTETPWFGTVEGFTQFKLYVKREADGHKYAGRTYRIAPHFIKDATINEADLDFLDEDLDSAIDALIEEG